MDGKKIAELRNTIAKASPLDQWTGSSNFPFEVTIKKPRQSLSKHEGTPRGANMWNYHDGAYLLTAVHELPKALDEIELLQKENKALYEVNIKLQEENQKLMEILKSI